MHSGDSSEAEPRKECTSMEFCLLLGSPEPEAPCFFLSLSSDRQIRALRIWAPTIVHKWIRHGYTGSPSQGNARRHVDPASGR